jgi:MYXO-CTERM domain-containing protein
MMAIYHLFGDPALRVAKGRDVPGTGGSGGTAGTDEGGSGFAGLATDGCSVGWSGPQANGVTLLLLSVLALAWRRRRHRRQA